MTGLSRVAPLALPPFYCPFKCSLPACAKAVEQQAIAWLDAFGLCENHADRAWTIATHAYDHCCRTCPEAREDLLVLYAEWMYLAFTLDDTLHDDNTGDIRTTGIVDANWRILRSIEIPVPRPMLPEGPVAGALADLIARSRAAATPVQFRRLAEGIREWLFSVAWQASLSERGVSCTLAEYAALRPATSGARFHTGLMEICNQTELPDAMLSSRPMQAAIDASGFLVGCDNDILGYIKDQDDDAAEPNVVDLIARERNRSIAEALVELVALRDRGMTLFIDLTSHLSRDVGTDQRRFIDSLRNWVAGHVAWAVVAPRYASPRHQHALPLAGARLDVTLTDRPSDANREPLPIPTIAWWWDQLPQRP